MELKIVTHPSVEILELFHDVMRKEFEEHCGHGLYGNYDIIYKLFKTGHAIVCLKDGKPIGFTTWNRWEAKIVTIDLTWFHPSERSFFAAKKFLELVSKEFRRRRDKMLKSKCVTLNGLCIAEHSGFIIEDDSPSYKEFKERYPWERGSVMFKRSIPVFKLL